MAKAKKKKNKTTTKKQRKENPTNARVGYDTIKDYRSRQKKALEKMFR